MFLTIKARHLILVITSTLICLGLTIAFASSQNDKSEVPILMYHSILNDTSKSKEYIITPQMLETDLKYIKSKGYTAITVSDLVDYVYKNKDLPEKAIILSFDDGHYNNYHYAFPLMKKYNMKMVISVVGKYTDMFSDNDDSNPNYSYMTWNQINELQKSGYAEILNHTYNLHSINSQRHGCKKTKNESIEDYKKILTEDLGLLQKKLKDATGKEPVAFTYPYGGVSNASYDILKEMGFKASLSCGEGTNIITKDPNCLYMLKRYNRSSKLRSEEFLGKILK